MPKSSARLPESILKLPEGCESLGTQARLHLVPGFRTASVHAGLKTAETRPHDMALLIAENGAHAAGVFTKNLIQAAPVILSKRHLRHRTAKAVIVNAGNANCCTGDRGMADAEEMCSLVAQELSCDRREVLVASTGIIGKHLPMDKIRDGIHRLLRLTGKRNHSGDFSKAILTTDLVPKRAGLRVGTGKSAFQIVGCVKGSGMIAPNLGTMLGFIATDLAVPPDILQKELRAAVKDTFNRMTVDGDTSTNDTVFLLANAGGKPPSNDALESFQSALRWVCASLAFQIAKDGEGASRTAVIFVGGARNDADANKVASTIAHSPLVKTALAGGDPNWGRIAAAAGRSGAKFNPKTLSISIGDVDVFMNGEPTDFNVRQAEKAMRKKNVAIVVMLGDGPGSAHFTTCDFTKEYIRINADYHT